MSTRSVPLHLRTPSPAPCDSAQEFLTTIDKTVPAELDVHQICDNYATHKTDLIQNRRTKTPRFHIQFIPTGSSRLNVVERFFAAF